MNSWAELSSVYQNSHHLLTNLWIFIVSSHSISPAIMLCGMYCWRQSYSCHIPLFHQGTWMVVYMHVDCTHDDSLRHLNVLFHQGNRWSVLNEYHQDKINLINLTNLSNLLSSRWGEGGCNPGLKPEAQQEGSDMGKDLEGLGPRHRPCSGSNGNARANGTDLRTCSSIGVREC